MPIPLSAVYCGACGSDVLTYLGTLGRRIHLRCRHCGADCSMLAEDLDVDLEPED